MINNDILRSLRYTLDLNDQKVVEICQLARSDFPKKGVTKKGVRVIFLSKGGKEWGQSRVRVISLKKTRRGR